METPPSPKKQTIYSLLVFGGILGLCFLFLFLILNSLDKKSGHAAWGEGKGPHIGVIELTGAINDSKDVLGALRRMRKDDNLKAIVLRIDSPGGAVAPSQEMYQAVMRARKSKKVVCSLGTVAASGGYYVAAACDKIFADPGTITGSIGVISEVPHVQKLLELARVDVDTIKSGAMKDVGSPLRPMTADERKFFQGFVDNIYEQFLDAVAVGRHLEGPQKEALRKIADGRILTGVQAKEAKLVDELGSLEDAIEGAAKMAGAEGEPVPVFHEPEKTKWWVEMLKGATQGIEPKGKIEVRDPRF